jgi:hypothetical protein
VAVTKQDVERIYGCAKALLQEKRAISIEDVSEYMRTVINAPMLVADIEECLVRLFEKAGNDPAVDLHQAFLFRDAAVGYWLGVYRILVLQIRVDRGENGCFLAHAFYGVPDDGQAKLLGISLKAANILAYLKEQGVEIERWFPLADWTKIVKGTREETLKHLGNLSKSLSESNPIGFVA